MEYEDFHLVKIGDHTFVLEQCKDFSKGLSNREHLLENEGMLFNFKESGPKSFHMKDCYLPLDILFIKEGKIQKIYHNCSPCETDECQKFEHDSADTIIELLGGTCESNNISEGLIYRLM
jgi:uncharacterized membrane protein (UPF0127 family)